MQNSPRIRTVNNAPPRGDCDYVLYWMVSARRSAWSFGLDRAVAWARELGRPLVVLEALRLDYPHASQRLHRFIIEGMADQARAFADQPVVYYPYVEPHRGAASGLLQRLAARAGVVVTDEFPAFFLPQMIEKAARRIPVKVEAVDGNGLFPCGLTDRPFTTAHSFRRYLQRHLPDFLLLRPSAQPFAEGLPAPDIDFPAELKRRWAPAPTAELSQPAGLLAALPIDHQVTSVDEVGGEVAGRARLRRFVDELLPDYAERRNHPDDDASSGLSPYLHFGFVSAHEVFAAVEERENWDFCRLTAQVDGSRRGFWGMGESAEAFLDQLVTWRELGFNQCWHRTDYAAYDSLPQWARETLSVHTADTRMYCYELAAFESSQTHDAIWNAAQTQLRTQGRIHNYLRMLWGKKIVHWSSSPRRALEIMIELNDRYALDGRDPNSYTGILWCLGRHDRPWGPERSVFGKVRFMSSANTARKLRLRAYMKRFGRAGDVF